MSDTLDGKTILCTGGSGSLGNALVDEIKRNCQPKKFIVYSRNEYNQFLMGTKYEDVPWIRFLIGDVRDKERLSWCLKNVDYVIHAAAMKRIEVCEYAPIEAIRTNIDGSVNVVQACMQNGVRRAVLVSTDKACVDYHAPVLLADGTTRSISSLVKTKGSLLVQTWTGKDVGTARITGWHKNKLSDRQMIAVTYEHSHWKRGALVTEDHPILTSDGWIPAGQLTGKHRLVTIERAPNAKQMSFLTGTLLGDAWISSGFRPSLGVSHCGKQKEWFFLKRDILSFWSPGVIQETYRNKKHQYRFGTSASSSLKELRGHFYKGRKKIVPKEMFNKYFGPEMLAAWYMDDGCLADRRCDLARIATHGFSFKEVEWLVDEMNRQGFEVYLYRVVVNDKSYPELRFTKSGSRRLYQVIGPLVVPSMRYKLPSYALPYNSLTWNLGTSDIYFGVPVVRRYNYLDREPAGCLPQANRDKVICKRGHQLSGSNVRQIEQTGSRQCLACVKIRNQIRKKAGCYPKKDVYCLDVEGTHNFIVNGIVLHNCQPINLYGATKMVAEKLFLAANSYLKTQFRVIRYGNVLDSHGSVVEIFRKLKAQGVKTFPITHPECSRFFWTLPQAAQTVLAMLTSDGPDLVIPKLPSMRIVDLARAIDPTCDFDIIGLKQGEKLSEIMTDGYSSDMNTDWLSPEDLQKILGIPENAIDRPEVCAVK